MFFLVCGLGFELNLGRFLVGSVLYFGVLRWYLVFLDKFCLFFKGGINFFWFLGLVFFVFGYCIFGFCVVLVRGKVFGGVLV